MVFGLDGGVVVARGEFASSYLDTDFPPLPKLIGDVLWRFRLLDRSATRRFHFPSRMKSRQAEYDRSTALRYHSDVEAMSLRRPYGFRPASQQNSLVKLNAGATG